MRRREPFHAPLGDGPRARERERERMQQAGWFLQPSRYILEYTEEREEERWTCGILWESTYHCLRMFAHRGIVYRGG